MLSFDSIPSGLHKLMAGSLKEPHNLLNQIPCSYQDIFLFGLPQNHPSAGMFLNKLLNHRKDIAFKAVVQSKSPVGILGSFSGSSYTKISRERQPLLVMAP